MRHARKHARRVRRPSGVARVAAAIPNDIEVPTPLTTLAGIAANCGERALLAGVVLEALDALRGKALVNTYKPEATALERQTAQRQARAWFGSDARTWPFSFLRCWEVLEPVVGVSADAVRAVVLHGVPRRRRRYAGRAHLVKEVA